MDIPKQAKKVFTGEIVDVYQWDQEMFDGSTAVFEMIDRPDTASIIAVKGDKIVLSRQSQPTKHDYISLFGGRIEENEDVLEGAKRELLEESGLSSADWELFKVYSPFEKIRWDIYFYIARNCVSTAKKHLDVGEKIEMIEMTFEEFISTAEDPEAFGESFTVDILKMKLHPELLAQFKSRLFT